MARGTSSPWTVILLFVAVSFSLAARSEEQLPVLESRKIWDRSPHNAFTDLIRFDNRWICAFREASSHLAADGKIRIIDSADGTNWASLAQLDSAAGDLRDPKLAILPDGRLSLWSVIAYAKGSATNHQSVVWNSADGAHWMGPAAVGEPDVWLWRVLFQGQSGYAVGYSTTSNHFARLYRSTGFPRFDPILPSLFVRGYANEAALVMENETLYCLLRRDGQESAAQFGSARSPFVDWVWSDLGVKIGSPALVRTPKGQTWAVARFYDPIRTSLCSVDLGTKRLKEIGRFPSGGDCAYPGLVWDHDKLWVSYYSSHEGRAAIYLSTITAAQLSVIANK